MKQYQINRQRAIKHFNKHANEDNPPIQMVFPLAEIVAQLQQGMKQLIGMLLQQTIQETMQQEVQHLVGSKSQPNRQRQLYRWEPSKATAWCKAKSCTWAGHGCWTPDGRCSLVEDDAASVNP